MIEPWVRYTLEGCAPDFYELAMKARPYSDYLRSIQFLDSVHVPALPLPGDEFDSGFSDVTVLVPPHIAEAWIHVAGDDPPEWYGEQLIEREYLKVCEDKGFLSAEELGG